MTHLPNTLLIQRTHSFFTYPHPLVLADRCRCSLFLAACRLLLFGSLRSHCRYRGAMQERIDGTDPCFVMASLGMLQNGLSRELIEMWLSATPITASS